MHKRGPWQVHDTAGRYENAWIALEEHTVTRPDGAPGVYGVIHFRNRALAILPIHTDGSVTLVGQHRFPHDRYSWEIPEGGGALDRDPLDEAKRELAEETGLSATSWREILRMDLSNSVTDETAIGWIATGLKQGEAAPEGTEELAVRRIPFRSALDEVMRGDITDALTVAMLLRAYYMAVEGELDDELATRLLARPQRGE
ncbi:NUDIX domain-containing protein [Maricaulis sp. CAU 1757]